MRIDTKTPFITVFFLLTFCSFILAQSFDLPITTKSNDARNLFKEGRAYLENVHIVKAANLLDKAIELDNDFALAHLYRAVTFVGGFNVAQKHLKQAVNQIDNVTGGEKNLILYQKALNDGDQIRQKMYLDNLIVAFPYNKRIQQLAGNYFYGISDYLTALKHLRKSVEIDENFAPSYNMIGYAESTLENYDKAELAFKKYIELMPNHPNPYDSYAELLLKQGKYDESILQYQKAFDMDNTFNTALLGIGHNYIFKGDFDKAREMYDKSLSNSSTINQKLGAMFWTATSYIHEGNLSTALDIFNERKKLAKREGLTTTVIGATNLEGFILTEMGQPETGMKKFVQAGKMIKNADLPKEIKTNLNITNRLNMCYALTANNKISEAEQEAVKCEKVINERGNSNEMQNLHRTLARLDMKKGDYKSAISRYNKIDLTNSPFDMQKLAVAYEKTGNTQMSNKYFNLVKTSNQNGLGFALIRNSIDD